MLRALYTGVSAMITQEAKQNVITNNIANINTNGFKADNIAVSQFKEVMLQNFDGGTKGNPRRQVLGSISLGSRIDETKTDYSQGILQETGKDTDFAIEGRGFFAVLRGDSIYYTRDGEFHIDPMGYLVNSSGDRVLGVNSGNRNLEPIFVSNGTLSLNSSNDIYINDLLSYEMYTVDFENYSNLEKIGDNLYQGQGAIAVNSKVKQKQLEKSNVSTINEMVNMMNVMRNFETSQKIVQMLDETLSKAANEIGNVR